MYSELCMVESTTILLKKEIVEEIKKAKESPRQTYNELLDKMVKSFLQKKNSNQYDEFLHKIQQEKMKDLWDNKEDEAWEHA